MTIPNGPETLTTTWLTEALRTSEAINQANVTSYEIKSLTHHGGITGQLTRLCLNYDRYEVTAPTSLIAKFSAPDPAKRNGEHGKYEREVRFYRQIAPYVELRTPHCYYSDLNPETSDHVLLLEDMAPARNSDWAQGCSLTEAVQAIQTIAKFHAQWWESPKLAELGISNPDQTALRRYQANYQASAWRPFLAKVGAYIPAEIRAFGERIDQYLADIFTYLQQPPLTLAHGDYKPDNFLFATAQGGPPFAVIDWQVYLTRRGVFDVAYFLCGGVKSEIRRQKELDWLRSYHTILLENGVRDYPFEQCLFDYRLAVLMRLIRLINVIGNTTFSQAQEEIFYRILLPRTCSAMLDFDWSAVLAELKTSISIRG